MTRNVVVRALLVLAGGLVLLAAVLPVPAQATAMALIERDGEPVTVTVNGRTVVDAGETVDAIWVANGRATVDGRVEGSVVVLNGGAVVSGSVGGDLLVVRGDVWIGPEATIGGDVRASRPITVSDGAVVDGTVRQTSVVGGLRTLAPMIRTALWVGLTVALIALGLVAVRLAPDLVGRAGTRMTARPFGSAARGIAVLLVLPLLALVTLATIIGGLLGVLLLALTALMAVAGLTVAATTIGRWVLPGRSIVLGFLVGATVLRIVALLPYVGDLLTIIAALFGTGALLFALRERTIDRDEPPVAPGRERSALAGPAATPEGEVNLDLRPGYESFPVVAEPDDEPVVEPVTARQPSWLDRLLARVGARRTIIDLRDDESGVSVVDGSPVDPDRPPTTGRPRSVEPSDSEGPHVIAALAVREDRFAHDPAGPVGNGSGRSLFREDPGAPLEREAAPPLFADATADSEAVPRSGPLFAPAPSAESPRNGTDASEPPLFAGPDGAPAESVEPPGYTGPLFVESEAMRMPTGEAAARERLFADGPADREPDELEAGRLFSGRAWRPRSN